MAATLVVLAVVESLTAGRFGGILAVSRTLALVTFGVLLAAPLKPGPARTPDIVMLMVTSAALAIDALAAASRFAPALVPSHGSALGLHLLAALLIGSAAFLLGLHLIAGNGRTVAALLLAFGSAQIAVAGAAVHGSAPTTCYAAALAVNAAAGLAYLLIPASRRNQ